MTLGREWRHREARDGDAVDDGWKGDERERKREEEGERGRRRAEHVVRKGAVRRGACVA